MNEIRLSTRFADQVLMYNILYWKKEYSIGQTEKLYLEVSFIYRKTD